MIAATLIAIVVRLHAGLLRFYPRAFRQRFGAPMRAAMVDALTADAQRHGIGAALSVALRALADLASGIAPARAHHARQQLLWPEPHTPSRRRPAMITDSLLADGRFALRTLRKAPLFSLLLVLALACGLGATSAIFAVVQHVLLRPLPYQAPDRLVMIWSDNTREGRAQNPVSPANFLDYRAGAQSFQGIEGMYSFLVPQRLTTSQGIEVAQAAVVTPNLLRLLGRAPLVGRTFAPNEVRGVVVLSHGYWQRRFGGDTTIVGRVIPLTDQVIALSTPGSFSPGATVIGVMPPDFAFPYRSMLGPSGFSKATDVDMWLPLAFEGPRMVDAGGFVRNVHYLGAIGRLKDGVSVDTAQAELSTVARRLEQAWPVVNKGWGVTVTPLLDQTVGTVRPALLALFSGVVFLLIMTCVNVANLLLARSVARRGELAVRAALGAGRLRLVQQVLVESLVLAVIGGVAALLVARAGIAALLALAPAGLPRADTIALDFDVAAFTLGTAVVAGIVIGAVASLALPGVGLGVALAGAGRGSAGAQSRRGTRAALVITEIALAVVLTAGSGLLIRSFVTLLNVHPGFAPDALLTLQMNVPDAYGTADKRLAYYRTLFERLEAVPGVESVGGTTRLPLGSTSVTTAVSVEGVDVPEHARPEAEMRRALHDYFRAMRIPLLAGRLFTRDDGPSAAPVAIINRALAQRLFGRDEAAVGRRVRFGPGNTGAWLTVVGVVGNIRHQGLEVAPAPEIYIHYLQGPPVAPFLTVRATGDPAALADSVRAAILSVDRSAAVFDLKTMMQVRSASVAQRRFVLALGALFGALALILAGLGVYGVMALIVTERTQEVGVRLALGARPVEILGLMMRQCLTLTSIGIAAGLVVAGLLAPALATQLYGVSAFDPLTYVAVPAVLACVAMAAAAIPARGAMRVDPVTALRGD